MVQVREVTEAGSCMAHWKGILYVIGNMCLLCACVLGQKYTINIMYNSGKYICAILYLAQTGKIINTALEAKMKSAINIF